MMISRTFNIRGLISTNGGDLMMIKADQRHLYLQVIERLKKDIETGVFKENERFPSEFELRSNTWCQSCNTS